MKRLPIALPLACIFLLSAFAESRASDRLNQLIDQIEPRVIDWRRHFHQFPELSNREFRTAEKIAAVLRELGLEVQTGIAHTGVVATLQGGRPGPVVALRADMDALPVTERVDVPFASRETAEYDGQVVDVMHACGHDTHMAILLGVASVLSEIKEDLPGTVKFIFQPAEEGAPEGEEGGAEMMVSQGVLKNPDVDVIFGLHISSRADVRTIEYRSQGIMAAADRFRIRVKGKQTHGSTPWTGADPVVAAAQIVNGLQTIVSRQMDLTVAPAVLTVGIIRGGVRNNIIPEEVEMVGTIRTLDETMQAEIHRRIKTVAASIAESMGTVAEVDIYRGYPITYNDPDLTQQMLPTLQRVAGEAHVIEIAPIMGAEDFSFFQREVPGLFFFLGGKPPDVPVSEAAPHHTPDFYIDESGLKLGVEALTSLAIDYMRAR